MIYSGTDKVRNSRLGLDPDLSAKNGPELALVCLNRLVGRGVKGLKSNNNSLARFIRRDLILSSILLVGPYCHKYLKYKPLEREMLNIDFKP